MEHLHHQCYLQQQPNPSKTDVSSRYQQIIDAFLNDSKNDIFRINKFVLFFIIKDLTSTEFDSLPLCVHAVLYEAISHVALHPKFDLTKKTYEFIGREELSYHDPKLFDKNFHPV